MPLTHHSNEWQLLQNQFDSFEKYSLKIKLLNITLFTVFLLVHYQELLAGVIILTLWLQDAIWKTFQARIEPRLMALEQVFSQETPNHENAPQEKAFQFNTDFIKNRPSTIGLFKEYLVQALRPTVAFPHAVLFITWLAWLFL